MKDPEVCKNCRYRTAEYSFDNRYKHKCNYLTITGHSRLVVEMENGGVQTDSCICFEEKGRKIK